MITQCRWRKGVADVTDCLSSQWIFKKSNARAWLHEQRFHIPVAGNDHYGGIRSCGGSVQGFDPSIPGTRRREECSRRSALQALRHSSPTRGMAKNPHPPAPARVANSALAQLGIESSESRRQELGRRRSGAVGRKKDRKLDQSVSVWVSFCLLPLRCHPPAASSAASCLCLLPMPPPPASCLSYAGNSLKTARHADSSTLRNSSAVLKNNRCTIARPNQYRRTRRKNRERDAESFERSCPYKTSQSVDSWPRYDWLRS